MVHGIKVCHCIIAYSINKYLIMVRVISRVTAVSGLYRVFANVGKGFKWE